MAIAIALLGFASTLVAIVLGAKLTERTTEKAESRRRADAEHTRKREVQAAARLVHAELGLAGLLADSGARDGSLVGMGLAPVDAWRAHAALLAAELPDDVHAVVAETCTKLFAVVGGTAALRTPAAAAVTADQVREVVVPLIERIREAQIALAEYAYPTGDGPALSFVPARAGA